MAGSPGKRDWYQEDHIDKLLNFYLGNQPNLYLFSPLSATNYNKKEGQLNNLRDVFVEYGWQREKEYIPQNEQVIMPVLIGENHWVLLSIDYAKNSNKPTNINYFDPLGGAVSREVSQAFDQIYPENPVAITNISKRVQHDGYNCGAWVVEAARSLVERNELPMQCNITEKREEHNRVLITKNPKIDEAQQPPIRQQEDIKQAQQQQKVEIDLGEEEMIVPHPKPKARDTGKPVESYQSNSVLFSFNSLYESEETEKKFQQHELTDRQRYEQAYEQLTHESLPQLAARYHQWANQSDYLPGRIMALMKEQQQQGKDGAYHLGKNAPEKLQTLRDELVHMLARECSINPTHHAQLNEQPQVTPKIKSRM